MTKIATSKQHPYSSHISKFAIFPSFYPPGDAEPGVRASSRPVFNSDTRVLNKTKGKRGTSYDNRLQRSDISENVYEACYWQAARVDTKSWSQPQKPGRVLLSGWENTDPFLWVKFHIIPEQPLFICSGNTLPQRTEQLVGEKQVFHPTPPDSVFPNPKLGDWELSPSLSERTRNILKNLERSRWITSYQLQYTGKDARNWIRNQRVRKWLHPPFHVG